MYLPSIVTVAQIPYGAMLPQRVEGLIVAAAISATHVAQSVARQDPMWVVTGQAAGIAAAMSVQRGVSPRQLAVGDLQQELLKQKCKLVHYYDVPADHAEFGIIQRMSIRGVVQGDDDRNFRPDSPLTRAEAAALIVKAFNIWPSVTHSHFDDVAYKHWAFRYIETLCDNNLLAAFGFEAKWRSRGRFVAERDAGYQSLHSYGNFEPDKPVTAEELAAAIRAIKERGVTSPGKQEYIKVPVSLPDPPQGTVTRATALRYVESCL
ncbi:MAG: FAD-dependent oxidoreductase [Acidobacteriota bacterium]